MNLIIKGSVCEKWKGVLAYVKKYSMVIATNLTTSASTRKNLLKTSHTEERTIQTN